MARFCAAILLLALLPGWTDTRGIVRVDAASPDKPYDFVVHVRNIPDIKYNPLVRQDRHHMAEIGRIGGQARGRKQRVINAGLGLVILLIGLRIAWRLTCAKPLAVAGPFDITPA